MNPAKANAFSDSFAFERPISSNLHRGHYHPQINGFSSNTPLPSPYTAAVWIVDNPTQEIDLGVSQWFQCVLEKSLVEMYEMSSLFSI